MQLSFFVFALFSVGCNSLLVQPRLGRPVAQPLRAGYTPHMQFGEPGKKLSRDDEPEEFFTSSFEELSDAEKLKTPGVIIGLVILVAPFIAGMVALAFYR